jgi:hypothetical protein
MNKALLLSNRYEVLDFISERRIYRLLCNDKVEIISNWNFYVDWGKDKIQYPALLKLKYDINRNFFKLNFSKRAIIHRDNSRCQYCGKKLISQEVTIDHVMPKAQGGKTSFLNCVVCCRPCNLWKGNNTPSQAGMVLIKEPKNPQFSFSYNLNENEWHESWNDFIFM